MNRFFSQETGCWGSAGPVTDRFGREVPDLKGDGVKAQSHELQTSQSYMGFLRKLNSASLSINSRTGEGSVKDGPCQDKNSTPPAMDGKCAGTATGVDKLNGRRAIPAALLHRAAFDAISH